MANEIDDGGPAFPHLMTEGHVDYAAGLSIRDWFAAHVEPGEDMSPQWAAVYAGRPFPQPRDGKAAPVEELASFWAAAMAGYRYAIADAMIAARKVTS